MHNIAFLTSTISPDADVYLLRRNNVEERLKDYENALTFYCGMLKKGVFESIVYVDNSGYPLDSLKVIAANLGVVDQIEFISYKSQVNPHNSRYFLEIHLIDYGMQNSKHIQAANNPMVWKITGRYIIDNIDKIVRDVKHPVDLYVNFRNIPYQVVDFYLVAFTAKNYSKILGDSLYQYAGTKAGELILRKKIDSHAFEDFNIVIRFREVPRLLGVRGCDNKPYNSLANNAKYYIRVFSNIILPRLWI